MDNWSQKGRVNKFEIREITDIEVVSLISKLGDSTAFGHDMIDSLAIKLAAVHLYRPIKHLVNLSIRTTTFATKWKMTKIVPLKKSKDLDKMEPSSYRPVCLLSPISKIVERTVQQQLSEHLENTGQLNTNQHAYRTSLSTSSALIQMTDIIYTATDRNQFVEVMALDQSSAFDCVNRDILYRKLSKYNIGEKTLKWISTYMENRTQYTSIGNSISRMVPVERGVPQGSVLGPLLYLVYINEMSESVKNFENCTNSSHLDNNELFGRNCEDCGYLTGYADDASYICYNKKRQVNENKIHEKLKDIKIFLNSNHLTINPEKTTIQELILKQKRGRNKGKPPSLNVITPTGVQKTIEDSKVCKILGGKLQNNLTWGAHLESSKKALLPEIRKQLGALYHIGKKLPQKSKLTIANGLILSRINYLIPLWGWTTDNYVRRAQAVLNSTARWITGLKKRTKTSVLMARCNWLNIRELTAYHSLLQIWKTIHMKKPKHILDSINIDQEYKLNTDHPRLQFTTNCYKWKTINLWNEMELEMRQNKKIASFKISVKKWIKGRQRNGNGTGNGIGTPLTPDDNSLG